MRLRGGDFGAIRGLGAGLSLQIVCYAGIFLALAVAARALSPGDFGIYASTVATGTFLGSVMTLGADRLLLRQLTRHGSGDLGGRKSSRLLLPFVGANAIAILAAALLVATGAASPSLLFVAILACLTASRLVLSAVFKYRRQRSLNIIAVFSLQPLFVSVTLILLPLALPGLDAGSSLAWWFCVTLFWESVQFVILLGRAGSKTLSIDAAHLTKRGLLAYSRAGMVLSAWVLLAMTGLLSIALGSLVFAPETIGMYTLAFRVAQLLYFPFIGASQALIPISIATYSGRAAEKAVNEAQLILRSTFLSILVACVIFVGFGEIALRLAFDVTDSAVYHCTLILGAGNVLIAGFGIGDQIMVSIGMHYRAFQISLWCGILFIVLFAVNLLLGGGILGLAIATIIPLVTRCASAYLAVRRRVSVPVAVFDRA